MASQAAAATRLVAGRKRGSVQRALAADVPPIVRRACQAAGVAGTLTLSLAAAGAVYHRPQPDFTTGSWGGARHHRDEWQGVTEEERSWGGWFTAYPQPQQPLDDNTSRPLADSPAATAAPPSSWSYVNTAIAKACTAFLSDVADELLHVGYRISQHLALGACNLVIDVGMSQYNTHGVLRDDRYDNLIECVRRTNRTATSTNSRFGVAAATATSSTTACNKPPTSLLTVSNHASTIDDPVIFGLLLPDDIKCRPEKLRWGLCSQEICFKHPAVASVLGAGKVLPIRRGGGTDQILLGTLAAKLWGGSWVHVFPEGKVVQSGHLGANYFGTRPDGLASEVGRLKWGVGRMVAHAACQDELHVVPIHHVGMEGVVPQKPTGETLHVLPVGGNYVKVRVGKRVRFHDLIRDHEARHGALTKYKHPPGGRGGGLVGSDGRSASPANSRWVASTESEMKLYSRIASRIEKALIDLEDESRSDPSRAVQEAYKKLSM